MKHFTLTLILLTMFLNLNAQRVVYSATGSKSFKKERSQLILEESKVVIDTKDKFQNGAVASLIPTVVDLGFKVIKGALERRAKKFVGEYTAQTSYKEAGNRSIPDIKFIRKIQFDEGVFQSALVVQLKAVKVDGLDSFYYYVEAITPTYSKAKTTTKSKLFDYTIELKPTFYVDGKKKAQELSPIKVTSIDFKEGTLDKDVYRTEMIPLPRDAYFSEVSIKIIETNPAKVNADRIIELYNKYEEDGKTIINNIITKEEKKSTDTAKQSGMKNDGKQPTGNPNNTIGN